MQHLTFTVGESTVSQHGEKGFVGLFQAPGTLPTKVSTAEELVPWVPRHSMEQHGTVS